MVVKLYREASGDEPHLPDPFTVDTAALMPGHELVLRYSDPDSRFGGDRDGRFGRLLLIVLMGAFAAGLLLLLVGGALLSLVASLHELLIHADVIADDPSVPWPVLVWVVVMASGGLLVVGPFALRAAAMSWRSARGGWWLRLSSRGFEVNDRPGRPRRYDWREIDKFTLVDGVQVCFRYTPGRRRTLANKSWRAISGLRDSDGTKADGLVMGYWDRPCDQAVDLMNSWLTRYRAA